MQVQPQLPSQRQQQQQHIGAGSLPASGRASPQSVIHHVVHPLFQLQLQSDPPLLTVRAADNAGAALEWGQQQGVAVLAAVSMRIEDLGHPSGAQLVVDIEAKPDRYKQDGPSQVPLLPLPWSTNALPQHKQPLCLMSA